MSNILSYIITGDNSEFINSMREVQNSVRETSAQIQQEGGSAEAVINKLASAAAAFGVGFSAVQFVKQVAQVRGEFQSLEQSFKVLLGNEERANDLMQQLTKTAAITPFDLQGVAKGAKQLLAYGMEADKVNDKIIELGNIASGLGLSIDYITTLYGTTVSKAHMDTMDLKQFKGQGIAIDEAIAKVMEVKKEAVPALITAGEVTGEIVEKAISQLAGVEGKFGGMMEQQSKTINGQISNIGDAFDTMLNNIGKSNEGIITDVLSGVLDIIENYQEVGKTIAAAAASYGAYKAVLMTITALQGVGAKKEAVALKELMTTQGSEHAIEVTELAQKEKISRAEAEVIVKIKEEVRERERLLKAEVAEAEAAAASAVSKQNGARNAVANLEREIEANNRQIASLQAQGKIKEADALITETQAKNQSLATAKKELDIATTNAQSATQVRNTAQKKLDTFQTGLQAAAQKKATAATNGLTYAQELFNKAMKASGLSALANPYVLLAAAAVAAGVAIYKLVTYQNEAEKSASRMNKAYEESQKEVNKELSQLATLQAQMATLKEGTDAYNQAKQTMINKYGELLPNIDQEITKVGLTAEAYKKLQKAITDSYNTKAYNNYIDKEREVRDEVSTEALKGMNSAINQYLETMDKDSEEAQKKLEKVIEVRDAIQSVLLSGDDSKIAQLGLKQVSGNITYAVNKLSGEHNGSLQGLWNDVTKDIIGFNDRSIINQQLAKAASQLDIYKKADERAKKLYGIQEKENKGEGEETALEKAQKRLDALTEEYKELKAEGAVKEVLEQKQKEYRDALAEVRKLGGQAVSMFYQDALADALQDWGSAKAKLEQLKKNNIATGKEYSDAVAAEKEAKERYEKLGGDTSAKGVKKAADAAKKRAEERKKLEEETAKVLLEASRTSGKLIENSVEKELANIQATYEDNVAKIKAQREKLLEAKNKGIISDAEYNTKNTKLSAYDAVGGIFDQQRQKQTEQYFKQQIESVNAVGLQEHAKYEQQKTQISEEWAKKRAELEVIAKSKAATDAQKQAAKEAIARTQTQEKADLAKVDLDEFKNSDYYKNVFGDLQNYGETTINAMMAKLQEYGSTLKDSMNPADIKAFEDAMTQLQMRMIEVDPFSALTESRKELNNALNEQQKKLKVLQKLEEERDIAHQNTIDAEKEYGKFSAEALNAKSEEVMIQEDLNEATEDYAKSENAVAQASNKVNKAHGKAIDALSDLSAQLSECGKQAGGAFEDVTVMIGTVVNLVQVSAQAIQLTSSKAQGALKAIETASVILAIIGAVMQAIQVLQNMFDDNEYEERMKAIREDVAQMDKAIRDMKREMALDTSLNDTIFDENKWGDLTKSLDVVRSTFLKMVGATEKAGENMFALQLQQGSLETDILNRHFGFFEQEREEIENATKVDWKGTFNIQDLEGTLQQAAQIIGTFQIKTKESKWYKIGSKDKYESLKDLGYDLYEEDGSLSLDKLQKFANTDTFQKLTAQQQTYISTLVENWEDYNKAVAQVKENMSSIFSDLGNTLGDALISAFKDGTDAAAAFEDSFYEMMMQIAKNQVISQYFSKIFEDMTQGMTDVLTTSGSDEEIQQGLTKVASEGAAQIKEKIPAATEAIEVWSKALNEAGLEAKDLTEQSATYGGYETMSEQTGTELSGRFSAMYIVQSQQLELGRQIADSINESNNILGSQYGLMQSLVTMHGTTNMLLTDMRESQQKFFVNANDALTSIAKYTKTLE